jgi:hypothetical protein
VEARALAEGKPASILGKSLGSAVAVHIAAQASPASLVLDSAFTSMREVIARRLPHLIGFAVPKLFESEGQVSRVRCPALVIHGAEDSLVPLLHARRLHSRLQCANALKVVKGAGHNDVMGSGCYFDWVLAFLRDPIRFTSLQREGPVAAATEEFPPYRVDRVS